MKKKNKNSSKSLDEAIYAIDDWNVLNKLDRF